ncbi:MAG TPA: hypothetical protein PKE10_00625 [Candidatus Saccharibacteria bacterium]|nr:hypothetical protein [Candidatus Saccharibacteria bacterium]
MVYTRYQAEYIFPSPYDADGWEPPKEMEPTQASLILLEKFFKDVDRPRGGEIAHVHQMLDLGSVFVTGKKETIPQWFADSIVLHDLFGRLTKADRDNGRGEYARYLTEGFMDYRLSMIDDSSDLELAKIYSILQDQVIIGESAKKHRQQALYMYEQDGESHDLDPVLTHAIHSEYQGILPSKYWQIAAPRLYGEEMRELVKNTHIESAVIKGLEILDNLKNPKEGRDMALLHDMLEAESFYIPLLEALRYDALAAEIESTCKIHRLTKQGRRGLIDKATEMYREAAKVDPALVAKEMFGLKEAPEIKWIVNQTSDDARQGLNCRFGEMNIELCSGEMVRVKFRQKSIGSLAAKLQAKEGIEDYNVMDLLGFTVIAGEEAHGQDAYKDLTEKKLAKIIEKQTVRLKEHFERVLYIANENDNIEFQASNSKKKPIRVEGGSQFTAQVGVDSIFDGMNRDVAGVKTEDSLDVYQVAKYTANITTEQIDGSRMALPVELQCVTGYDHMQSKVGVTNHSMYKSSQGRPLSYEEKASVITFVEYIHKRRHFFGEYGINERSYNLGKSAVRHILQGVYPQFAKNAWNNVK